MTDDPQYRSTHTHAPDAITLREADEVADDAMMEIRLPIASTGEVRNEGDDPLTRAELRGMARQINENTLGVFPEHGASDVIDFAGYSQFEKLGYWTDAEVEREAADDGEDMLYATARMPDPEPLPSQTGSYRQALSILKEQARRGVPITTSIGWREDENAPGGNDLLEVSIVGIPADPRTGTEGGQALIARAAVDAGADPEALVEAVRAAVEKAGETTDAMTDDDTPDEGTTASETESESDDGAQTASDDGETNEREEDEETEQCPECETDVREDANYCHECGEALGERETDEDGDEDDEEEDDEEEEGENDDNEEDDDRDLDVEGLVERIDDLEADLKAVRAGEIDIDTPDDDDDADERDADADDDADEQREASDPADKPDWATIN